MITLRHWTRSLWITVAVLAFAMTPAALSAQEATPAVAEPPAFQLEPVNHDGAYFTITQDPGTTQELTFAIGNAGEEPVTALTYVADAYSLINGGFGVKTADDPTSAPTTWIDYPTATLELEAGESREQTFAVTVPEGAASGQYIAGLAIQTAESIAVGDNDAFRQIIKKAIAVFITVPGPETPELTTGQASITQTITTNTLVIAVGNPGNVLMRPAGTVTMTTDSDEPVLTAPVTMGPVYAGTDTTLELNIPTLLEPGTYSVSVALEDEETGASAEANDVPVTVEEPTDAIPAAEPVAIDSVILEPLTEPDSGAMQAITIGVTLENPGAVIANAQLTMHVTRDGELIEDYLLNSSLVVPVGATEIQQRYIPLSGWEPGSYRFSLTLAAVNPSTGQITVLATHEVNDAIEVS